MVVFTNFICVSKYLSVYGAEAATEPYKNAPAFSTLFFLGFFARARFKNQTTRRTDDKLGFIVQHKLNQVFEYSNNDDENFKQLSPYLAYRGENKVIPPLMGSKKALVSVYLRLEHS